MNKREKYYQELKEKEFNPFSIIHNELDCSRVAGTILSSITYSAEVADTAIAAGYYLSLLFTYIYNHTTENNHNMDSVAQLLNASYLEDGSSNPNSVTDYILQEVVELEPDCMLAKLYASYEQCDKEKNDVADLCFEILLGFDPDSVGYCEANTEQNETSEEYDLHGNEEGEGCVKRFPTISNWRSERLECLKLVNEQMEELLSGKKLSELSLTELLLLKSAIHLENLELTTYQMADKGVKPKGWTLF